MILDHLIAMTIAFCLDLAVGDPPNWPHPVRWMGSLIAFFEKRLNHGALRRISGICMLVLVLLVVGFVTGLLVFAGYRVNPAAGILLESILICATISQTSLKKAALEVYDPLKTGDLAEARTKLSFIVGRDTDSLDEGEIARGAIETVAENTSDGITAPLFWAFIGGAPLAMLYRAVNTCDSMVGYKNERYQEFGWAAAKLDDFVNWIPSRLTGMLMLLGNRSANIQKKHAWILLFRDAKKHPSPNSGWGEAAVAAILGIQLGGINYYNGILSNRAKMGDAIYPIKGEHIRNAISIMGKTVRFFLLLLWIGGMSLEVAFAWIKSAISL